jgi:CheY-like chemotaxis protein/anti-sigma regulatory factor (Ser/Thr protein kinase)
VAVEILLVDDVLDVRRLVRTALRLRGGFDVVGEAADGGEAVRLAEQLQPDIVVLDLGLPDLPGRDVLQRIREVSPDSHVVVFTGTEHPDKTWIRDNVDAFVLKEADLHYLVDLLDTLGRGVVAQAVLELPEELTSASLARRFVESTLTGWGLAPLNDDAVLVVSELVANAVTHGRSSSRLLLQLKENGLLIELADAGEGTPELQPVSDTAEHGRGLLLIGAVASAWGMHSRPFEGKLVWAEMALPGAGEVAGEEAADRASGDGDPEGR